ncbi:TPM domain-containing protein [Candidatus Woesearchaeota archaeon]|nr:TPM domain-containing protein [Candidatus Woesearchaeota archaeon]
MKLYILLLLLLIPSAVALEYELHGYVNDYAGVLTSEEEYAIRYLCEFIEQNTTAEIAVVTLSSLEGIPIEMYAVEAFERNGIGKADKDNGLLLVIAVEEREYRVEVGYGLEPYVPDASKVILGEQILVPYLREGNYAEGIFETVRNIGIMIVEEEDMRSTQAPKKDYRPLILLIVFIIFIIISAKYGGPIYVGGLPRGTFSSRGSFGGFGGGLSGGGGFSGRW